MTENDDLERFARELEALDFSSRSRVRGLLRRRLLAAPPRRGPAFVLRAAAAVAVAALAVVPALTRLGRRDPAALDAARLPVLSGRLPMPSGPAEAVFESAPAREVRADGGRALEWSLPGAKFRLESRPVTIDDIIVKPEPGGVL